MNTHLPVKKGLMALTILCIVSFVLLSGCTSGFNTPSVSTGEKGYSDGSSNYATPAYGGTQTAYATPMPASSAGNVYTNVNDRKVIMTASVSMETSEHDKVVNSIRSITTGAGGYVQSSSTWLSSTDKKQTTISIKVPAAQYESVLSQIKALGKIKSESSSGSDVTMTYIDLSARLKNLQAEEKQLTEIMGMSKNVTEILTVEKELFRVRGEIESTTQQLNYLGSQVDFSTITVTVAEPQPTVEYDWGIDTAFKEGIRAFIGMIGALIVVTGYLVPLILYLAIGLAILYFVARFLWNFYKSWKNKRAGKP
ncbi:DUF4349 domain-containing protein [Methanocella paludicola]|nr:DUF4349 domain-containing protein [Methanocella paludicola]